MNVTNVSFITDLCPKIFYPETVRDLTQMGYRVSKLGEVQLGHETWVQYARLEQSHRIVMISPKEKRRVVDRSSALAKENLGK